MFLHTEELDGNSEFTTRLHRQLELEGDWDCALCDITFMPSFQQGAVPPPHIYICSSGVDESIVRERGYQVLRRIPIRGVGAEIDHTFNLAYYMPVSAHRLAAITVCFKDHNLQPAKLNGRVSCTVHIKPRSKCQASSYRWQRL